MFASLLTTVSITRGAFASTARGPPYSSQPLTILGNEPMLLRRATSFGDCHIVSQPVGAETADSNAKNLVANTALTKAFWYGHGKLEKVLISEGARRQWSVQCYDKLEIIDKAGGS